MPVSLRLMVDPADIPPSTPMDAWLDALGQPTGAPGGGAAAGVMIAAAAALMAMVAGYTADDRVSHCVERLADRRSDALRAVEADGAASADFGAALALPEQDPERDERVGEAAIRAARSAARVGNVGVAMMPELHLLAASGNPHLAVDLAVAAEALQAGQSGASLTIRANVRIARAHGLSGAPLDALAETVARLSDARRDAAQVVDELSSRLD